MSRSRSYRIGFAIIGPLLFVAPGCVEHQSLGQRIYLEGRGEQDRLAYAQRPGWLAHGEFCCAACHGRDGADRSVRAGRASGSAPPITAAKLPARGYDQLGLLARLSVAGPADPSSGIA